MVRLPSPGIKNSPPAVSATSTNRALNKSLSVGSIPYILVIGFNYEAPKVTQNKWIRQVIGGWTLGGLMVYQSGALIAVPTSNTVLNNYTFMGSHAQECVCPASRST